MTPAYAISGKARLSFSCACPTPETTRSLNPFGTGKAYTLHQFHIHPLLWLTPGTAIRIQHERPRNCFDHDRCCHLVRSFSGGSSGSYCDQGTDGRLDRATSEKVTDIHPNTPGFEVLLQDQWHRIVCLTNQDT